MGVVVDLPANSRIENFARIINQYIQNVHNGTRFILRVQIPSNFEEAEEVYNKYVIFK
jgi:hypothetical protein